MNRYLILDTARCNSYTIHVFKNVFEANISLFHKTKDENLDDVAPWLFKTEEEPLKSLIDGNPNINFNSYLFANSNGTLFDLYQHFQKFIYKIMDGKEYYFRFYDPLVLRRLLPDYDKAGLQAFFGPVESFVMKGEDPAFLLEFSLKKGQLHTQTKEISKPNEIKVKPLNKTQTENINLS